MKLTKFLAFFALTLIAFPNFAQTKLTAKSTKITINGNSTMHKWSSTVAKSQFTGDFTLVGNSIKNISSAVIKMDVKAIKSNHDSNLMDNRTYETLKADKFPTITYEYKKTVSNEQKGNENLMKVTGNLTIAGVTKPVDLIIHVVALPSGEVQIKGTEKLLMSTFGITPPSFMAGTLKVDDAIDISFDVVLK